MCLESWEDYGNLPNDPKGIHALLDRQCPKDMARQRACLTEWLPSGGCSKPDIHTGTYKYGLVCTCIY